ncbi:hypothetical protein IFM51744_10911 [Aspergillus udagawae]|nr:hypothetical protein IFM51744_10911 [Aspergillus udagawae]
MGPLIAKGLEEERAARHRAEDDLHGMEELTNILLHLIEKIWVFRCTKHQTTEDTSQQQRVTLESILDSALAQLELQSVQIEYEQLRRENDQLRAPVTGSSRSNVSASVFTR